MESENVDHIGIVVENLENAINFYQEKFGMKVIDKEILEDRGLKVAFMIGKNGETALELLEPVNHEDLNNTIAKFLKNRGPGLHHIAIRVSNIEMSLKDLQNEGLTLIDKEPRKGARGHLVAFIHPKSSMGTLIELVQER
ncbi:methylmalonyl-CoA epimerase [Acidianus brierleyi]|uniref:Methylmalonyl-CoA epimerase n=1 Tax=Acidianus brierleyi TaxID=41673 RepID=A0A2U9IBI7_9CREN|nr:methylmalonyl-CoA epimerase [Acidianus brierleyi]AWR93363.1 methylmalonyl-CoA epimerase [Acidianus brierleyi]